MRSKVSMNDIARLAGVSVATVSRVINQNGRFSAETEKRVRDVISEQGYQVNLSAKTLRTRHSQSVAIIVPDITNEFFSKIVRAVENRLIDLDYTVFVCDSNESEEIESRFIKNLAAQDVDGIIYISGKSDVKEIYCQYRIPVVYIDRRPQNAGMLVISDNEKGGYLATKELIEKGCRDIIALRDPRDLSQICLRMDGYRRALEEARIEYRPEYVKGVPVDYTAARSMIRECVRRGVKFDGIFALTDIAGVGAIHALEDSHIRVGKDVKLVGFDDISLSQVCHPALTTIHQDTDLLGKHAVNALLSMIDGNNACNQTGIITVDVELICRETT